MTAEDKPSKLSLFRLQYERIEHRSPVVEAKVKGHQLRRGVKMPVEMGEDPEK